MNNLPNPQLAALALQFAQGQVGQREQPIGSNAGPMVSEYLKAVGLPPGNAWCQAFVYWCYQKAADSLGTGNPVVRTARVKVGWNIANPTRKLSIRTAIKTPKLIRPGCQFIMLFSNGTGHTGIVTSVEGNTLHTIEGNSNSGGSREGYEVVSRQRHLLDRSIKGFIIY